MRTFLLLLVAVLALGCQKDQALEEAYVADELTTYFASFVVEAAKRGVTVDFERIPVSGYLVSLTDEGVSAQCQHQADGPDRVVIDQTYWNRVSARQREFVVFHELGHCYLDRRHRDERDPEGNCLSMMHSAGTICHNLYNDITRDYYLDELFSNQ